MIVVHKFVRIYPHQPDHIFQFIMFFFEHNTEVYNTVLIFLNH